MVERVAAPMVHAYKEGFATEGKEIQTHVLHWMTEMARRRIRRHGVMWLRREKSCTYLAGRNQLLDIVDQAGPIIKAAGE